MPFFLRLRTADVQWLAAALAIGPLLVLLSAERWQRLSLGLLTRGEAMRYTWIGLFFRDHSAGSSWWRRCQRSILGRKRTPRKAAAGMATA